MVDDSGFAARLAASPFHGGDLEARVVQYSGPRDLGQTYRSRVALAENVKCVTGATVTALDVAESGKIVTGVRFSDLRHRSLRLRARVIVLAAGGIETPRLLLASGGRERGGLGNDHDVLGRYHMEHPMRSVGTVRLGSAARLVRPFTDLTAAGTAALEGTFGLSAERREADGLLNMHLRAYRYNRLEERSDIVEAKRAAASGGHAAVRALDMVRTLGPRGLPAGAVYGAWHFWNKSLAHAWFDRVRFVAFLEQEPDPQNRITLSGERDVHGCLLPHLGWRESRMMTDSVERSLRAIAAAFEERGLSEVKMGTEAVAHLQDYGGYGLHHMGATRMSDDPRTGVVDASCKVHGVENLYIAGSSVFPTGGAANPTLMISALGLRLGSRLKGTLSNRADCGIFSSRVSE
ncbi:GMC oxidoreductase [Rhodophyticola sp. MJ-SS7]|nr:GMC oxidoreductase [Rhodophyticola sp. MJ-SS7]